MIEMPVLNVFLAPIEKIVANDYNPNKVAPKEMKLLRHSIESDGFTQPIVTYHDTSIDKYVIVDGFHRYRVGKEMLKLEELPIVVINKSMNERVSSTIRHNRARGEHGIDPMIGIVQNLIKNGWEDADVAKELGMEADEVLRLKQMSGIAEIFKDHEYNNGWE